MLSRDRRSRVIASAGVALLAIVLLFGVAAPAFAAPAPYGQWRVSLWPEYDDQRTLVIFEPQLDASTSLPFKFSYSAFPLDAQVGMTCQVPASGSHQCQPRQTAVNGDLETITYTAPSERQLYMEFYTDMLKGQRPSQRKMTYTFVAPADIKDLQVTIKQPKDATGFTVTPKPANQQTDSDGYTLDAFDFQNVKAGQKYTFTYAYSRPTWTPPVAKTQNNGQGGNGGTQAATGGQQAGGQNSQMFMLLAVAALGGAFMMFLMRKPARRAPVKSSKSTSAKSASNASSNASAGAEKGKGKTAAKGGTRAAPRRSNA